jgi:hypothetical protein
MDRWIVFADVDEFLVYDKMESHGIDALTNWLEKTGRARLFAAMLDMYPENAVVARDFSPGDHPLSISPFFDTIGYELRLTQGGPLLYGGGRCRLLSPKRERLWTELAKHPVTFWDHTCANVWHHKPHPFEWNGTVPFGYLIHFKLLGDAKARFKRGVDEGQYWHRGLAYSQMAAGLERLGDSSFLCEHSARYEGPESLIRAGLMHPIDWDRIEGGARLQ